MPKRIRPMVIASIVFLSGAAMAAIMFNREGGFSILRDVVDAGGRANVTGENFRLAQAVAQAGGVGISSRGPFELASGFLPAKISAPTPTPTPIPFGLEVSDTEVTTGDHLWIDVVVNEPINEPFDAYIVCLLPNGTVYSTIFLGMDDSEVLFMFSRGLFRFIDNQPGFYGVPFRFRLLDITITDNIMRGPYTFIAAAIPADLPMPGSKADAQAWAIFYNEVIVTVY